MVDGSAALAHIKVNKETRLTDATHQKHAPPAQVYTALEKKALALIQLEENKQKEATILANFRKALETRLEAKGKAEGAGGGGDGGEA